MPVTAVASTVPTTRRRLSRCSPADTPWLLTPPPLPPAPAGTSCANTNHDTTSHTRPYIVHLGKRFFQTYAQRRAANQHHLPGTERSDPRFKTQPPRWHLLAPRPKTQSRHRLPDPRAQCQTRSRGRLTQLLAVALRRPRTPASYTTTHIRQNRQRHRDSIHHLASTVRTPLNSRSMQPSRLVTPQGRVNGR